MICAYCKEDKSPTREHLIPQSLMDVFPECDINYDYSRNKFYKGDSGLVIKDVCEKCNNEVLSELDDYGSEMVKNHFIKEYGADDYLVFPYDYSKLSRWLLKILYNNARSLKIDTSWFEANMDYINGENDESNFSFSIFSGLVVDMSPLPEFLFNNIKLGVYFNPIIIKDTLLKMVDPVNLIFEKPEEIEKIIFPSLNNSAILRFGSALFLVFLWNSDTDSDVIDENEETMWSSYPHVLLDPSKDITVLKRVTHSINCINLTLVDTAPGMYIVDQFNAGLPTNIDPWKQRKEASVEWDSYVKEIREDKIDEKKRKQDKRKKKKK